MAENKSKIDRLLTLLTKFIENPYYENFVERDLSVVSDYNNIERFLDSFRVWVEPIKDVTGIDSLIKRFREEHDYKTRDYDELLEENYLFEGLIGHEERDYDLGNVKDCFVLKTEYIDPIESQKKEASVGFLLINEVNSMLEISAIFLEDEFRGKSYNKKAYSEMLMEKALQKIERAYQKNILAYVQKGNKGPNHLFDKYGFIRKSSGRDGYIMYSLDFGKI